MATSRENLFISQHIYTTFLCLITYKKTNGFVRHGRRNGESGGNLWITLERIVQRRAYLICAIEEHNGLGIKATKRVGRQSYRHCKGRRVARRSKKPISSSPNWNIIDLHFLNKPKFFLNAFGPPPKFNPLNGDLVDEDAKLRLKQMLLSLKVFTLQIHHNN